MSHRNRRALCRQDTRDVPGLLGPAPLGLTREPKSLEEVAGDAAGSARGVAGEEPRQSHGSLPLPPGGSKPDFPSGTP